MKLRLLALVGLAIGLAAPAIAQEKMGTCSGPRDACPELENWAKSFDAAFNRKDAVAVAVFFAQDAVLVPEGPILSGRAAIEKFYSDYLKAGFSNLVVNFEQTHVAGDMAWAFGDWSDTGPGPNNSTQRYHGNWGGVLVRGDGIWKIRMETYNVIETPPEQNNAAASTNR